MQLKIVYQWILELNHMFSSVKGKFTFRVQIYSQDKSHGFPNVSTKFTKSLLVFKLSLVLNVICSFLGNFPASEF